MVIESEKWTLAVFRDAQAAGEAAADVVSAVIEGDPDAAISFPTGTTPIAMFDVLAARGGQAVAGGDPQRHLLDPGVAATGAGE